MATYKVIQDVEAEDKLVGPLTLRQFVYAGIGAVSGYLGFLMTTKGAGFMLVIFVPITAVSLFFAFPWGRDQPTEVWALAKIRFLLKPRSRVWDQSGTKDLVTITVPKVVEHQLTNGLRQDEVYSRLSALANTIDSRGWAVKNVNLNLAMSASLPALPQSDRLVEASSFPQEVNSLDVRASDDMLDEYANPVAQHVENMLQASSTAHHQQLMQQMDQTAAVDSDDTTADTKPQTTTQPPADYWFMNQGQTVPGKATFVDAPVVVPGAQQMPASAPQAVEPTEDEKALVERFKSENSSMTAAYGHLKKVHTPAELKEIAKEKAKAAAVAKEEARKAAEAAAIIAKSTVTPDARAVIMNLANSNDLDVATLARQAQKGVIRKEDGSVEIRLH